MNWKRKLIAGLLTTTAMAGSAHAQSTEQTTPEPPVEAGAPNNQTGDFGEDIVVTGIRASQAQSIDIKRESASIVDAISAEDIGKLPDVTIVDSLQRISGVQIVRSAGEGSTVNIRGLPQVITLLNGEQYLSPANLGTAQPNLNDIPAQLMSGVVVFKSPDVRNALSGISGTLDLRTRRPFDFKDGLTVSGQGEYQTGKITSTDDYLVSGLASYRTGRIGILASAAYSDITLGNNYAGTGGGHFLNNDWGGGGANWIAPHGYETFHREVERKRFGASGAIQWEIDDGVTLTAEGFYTRFIEHDLRAGMNISNRWTGLGWTNPTNFTETGITGPNGQPVYDVDEYDLDAWWVNSFSINRSIKAESKNFSLELEYDKGGPLTFSARGTYADADYLNTNGQVQGDLSNWQYGPDRTFGLFRNPSDRTRGTFYPADIAAQYPASQYSNGVVGPNGGRFIDPNPLGYGSDPQLHIDISGRNIVWSGFDRVVGGGLGPNSTLRDYMSNLDSYTVAAYSSEGNNRNNSDLYAARFDASYDFEKADGPLFGFLKRIDFGGRGSRRRTEIQNYHLFSRLYAGNGASDPNGCAAQWKAIDVTLNSTAPGSCRAGEVLPTPGYDPSLPTSATFDPNLPISATNNAPTYFQGYTAWKPTRLAENNNVYFLDDFGSVTEGFPGIWVADPRDLNDPLAFQERVFGNAFPVIIPGTSYDVDFFEQSGYANAVMEFGDLTVNAGLRAIHTKIDVRQNITGPTTPYGDTNSDLGDTLDSNDYWDFLPIINAQVDLTNNLKARASFSRTMIPLDLGNYGGGVTVNTADAPCANPGPTDAPCGQRQVTGANASGNPDLEPWRSTNYDVALEYYWGQASLLNAGVFMLDIASFVTTQTLNDGQFPDGDGVIRRTVPFTRPVQGEGGSLQGVEVGAKIAFSDILSTDSFLGNFGVDANYTYSDSAAGSGGRQRTGKQFPFQDNSAHQYNFALWYQDSRLQARAAYNRRSPRLTGQIQGIAIYQDTSQYVDLNLTYALTDNFSLYGNASNVFGEIEKYYYEFEEGAQQFQARNEFEPRYSFGVRAKF